MPFTLTMPKLSPTMTEGTIIKWRKKEGEFVEDGEMLIDVATDKATVEHAVLDGGWLQKIIIPEGSDALVNQVIAILTKEKSESIDGFIYEEKKPANKAEVSDVVDSNHIMAKAETKSQVGASSLGMLYQHFTIQKPIEEELLSSIDDKGRVKASPLAKKIAHDQRLDITTVQGTGPGGLVTSKDLELAQKDVEAIFGSKKQPSYPSGSYEEITLTPVRKVIAERLQQSKTFIPHFYMTQTVDAKSLHLLREELKASDIHLTFNDLITKAVALALKKHPEINRGFDPLNNAIVQFQTIDISIAVSIDAGLITPIVRNADFKNVGQIAKEIKYLADKAKKGTLAPLEYQGGSFTISNLGKYGIDSFYAIINPPQAAILAVGSVLDQPQVKDGVVVPGKMMTLNLSLDHRVIDGALGALFLKSLQNYIEHPSILLVH